MLRKYILECICKTRNKLGQVWYLLPSGGSSELNEFKKRKWYEVESSTYLQPSTPEHLIPWYLIGHASPQFPLGQLYLVLSFLDSLSLNQTAHSVLAHIKPAVSGIKAAAATKVTMPRYSFIWPWTPTSVSCHCNTKSLRAFVLTRRSLM